jgi:hypothetical protein
MFELILVGSWYSLATGFLLCFLGNSVALGKTTLIPDVVAFLCSASAPLLITLMLIKGPLNLIDLSFWLHLSFLTLLLVL